MRRRICKARVFDDAMILAHAANPDGSNFRKGQVPKAKRSESRGNRKYAWCVFPIPIEVKRGNSDPIMNISHVKKRVMPARCFLPSWTVEEQPAWFMIAIWRAIYETKVAAISALQYRRLLTRSRRQPNAPKPTKADACNVVQIITSDKSVKTQAYCDFTKLEGQVKAAEQKNIPRRSKRSADRLSRCSTSSVPNTSH